MIKQIKKAYNWTKEKICQFGRWSKIKVKQIAITLGILSIATAATVTELDNTSFQRLGNVNKVENKFELVAKDNPKDMIRVKIGGDGVDFKPEVEILRWDEVSFKVGLKTDKKIKVKQENGKLKWKDTDIEIEFYESEEGFKFVWYPNSKLKSNIVNFEIESDGLDFFYQPPLNEELFGQECWTATCTATDCCDSNRPENVVGSYAVYHSTKGGMNDINGMEYKAGKFGHIYRPHLYDSNGLEAWGDLHIENGIYSVEIPQEFLDKAVYPIKSNDVIGYDTAGGSNANLDQNVIWATFPFSSTVAGSVDQTEGFNFYKVSEIGTAGPFRPVLYKNSDDTIVDYGPPYTGSVGHAQEATDFNQDGTILEDTEYMVGMWVGGTTNVKYDTTSDSEALGAETYNAINAPPSPFDWNYGKPLRTRIYSMWITYTPGGAEEEAERRFFIFD